MDMDEQLKLGFEFAKDLHEQLITLSTAIIAVTITFLKDFGSGSRGRGFVCVKIAWIFFIVSIVFGVVSLMKIAGLLMPSVDGLALTGIDSWTRRLAGAQVIAFFLGTALLIVHGFIALSQRNGRSGQNS